MSFQDYQNLGEGKRLEWGSGKLGRGLISDFPCHFALKSWNDMTWHGGRERIFILSAQYHWLKPGVSYLLSLTDPDWVGSMKDIFTYYPQACDLRLCVSMEVFGTTLLGTYGEIFIVFQAITMHWYPECPPSNSFQTSRYHRPHCRGADVVYCIPLR